jgi:2-polyprenyl-3-methyl-5-hydroxy-6-metoxy-1,4-benzoquinol methylase
VAADNNGKADELLDAVREIQERTRARHPESPAAQGAIPLPDLMAVVHARDAAEAKVAAIGTVNPRPPGLVSNIVQFVKSTVARALDWHVREQVEFNRAVVDSIQAILESLSETRRSLSLLSGQSDDRRNEMRILLDQFSGRLDRAIAQTSALKEEARELKDIRTHWYAWRQDWEKKVALNEIQFLRSVADLQGAFTHRTTVMEGNFRDVLKTQHQAFEGAMEKSNQDIHRRFWADIEKVRTEYERLIHSELRLIRQRAAVVPPAPTSVTPHLASEHYDALKFAEKFRGTEEYVKQNLEFYRRFFEGKREVLDIGCGRGEFLAFASELGVTARGIDLSEECAALCRQKGFEAEAADLFVYLTNLADASLDGIFCSQVIEHLPVDRLPEMIRLAASKLTRNGVLAIETPNPECLAIFATHFYLDPTHTRPAPPLLTAFYMEEAGLGRIELHRLSPAIETIPELQGVPADFRDKFFGGMDYAAVGWKL